MKHGVVQDKLFLPGLLKLAGLVREGFFGRILSVRGEFGYWVFPGPDPPAQRPSWNYRREDGGGVIVDMFCHWRYVLDNLFAPVQTVTALGATHLPVRYDEGVAYEATAEDAAYAQFELEGGIVVQLNSSWCTRVDRDELLELHVDGTDGSAVAGLHGCRIQPAGATPTAVWNPDLPNKIPFREAWSEVSDEGRTKTASRPSGSFSCATSSRTSRSRGALPRARRASSSPSSGCGPGRSAGPSTFRRSRRESRDRARARPARAGRVASALVAGAWPPSLPPAAGRAARSRECLAAAHVVADPAAAGDPVAEPAVDWDATMAFRRHLWSYGLGVADAMDTAQRGGALSWPLARELIRRSAAEARGAGGRLVCGAATDQLEPGAPATLDEIRNAYIEQCELIEGEGAGVVMMASRHLAAAAAEPGGLPGDLRRGARSRSRARDPALARRGLRPRPCGLLGSRGPGRRARLRRRLIADHRERIDGIKVSLLDAALEVALRRRLPSGVRLYTGDDFNFPVLIRGDELGASDALLGVFDPIAPVAAAALRALDDGDYDGFERILAPTVPLARRMFAAPDGELQGGRRPHRVLERAPEPLPDAGWYRGHRSIVHLADVFRLAADAGVLSDPERGARRFRPLLELAGVDQA